ncbi:MAG: hypothetical protein A2V70_08530 [Planctomycetes bacterium RBG_13_63_9]|nr:MAG: hypothetical protein A2V70_08530 [Planctomycetes bacterium RBG_13_63_9]
MTLQPYGPEQLDQFALRLLDLAAAMRAMANDSREHEVSDVALHDKKALEWLSRLDDWADKVRADLEVKVRQSRAKRRALSVGP